MRRKLRQAIWGDKPQSDQSSDLRSIFKLIPDTEIRVHKGLYSAGMLLRVDGKPSAIELIRFRNPAKPKTALPYGSEVSFDLAANGDALITSIAGLTSGDPLTYEFTFRITYGAD